MAHCVFLVVFLSTIFCTGKIILLSCLIQVSASFLSNFPKKSFTNFSNLGSRKKQQHFWGKKTIVNDILAFSTFRANNVSGPDISAPARLSAHGHKIAITLQINVCENIMSLLTCIQSKFAANVDHFRWLSYGMNRLGLAL